MNKLFGRTSPFLSKISAEHIYAVMISISAISAVTFPVLVVVNHSFGESELSVLVAKIAASAFGVVLLIATIGWLVTEVRRSFRN